MWVCVGWGRGVMLAGEAGMCRVVFLFSFWVLGCLSTSQSQLFNSPITQHFYAHLSSPTSARTGPLFSDYLYLLICGRLQVVNTSFFLFCCCRRPQVCIFCFFCSCLFVCER